MISRPSFTCTPCTTEPGGDCAMLMPILIGSAAWAAIERPAAAVATASRHCREGMFIGCSSMGTIEFGVAAARRKQGCGEQRYQFAQGAENPGRRMRYLCG